MNEPQASPTPSPETDALDTTCALGNSVHIEGYFMMRDHARRLERQRDRLAGMLKILADDCAERVDILDGNDGPKPNIFMHWQTRIEALLAEVGKGEKS